MLLSSVAIIVFLLRLVLRKLGSQVKADYSSTLLSLAVGRQLPAPCPLAFGEGDAKPRIKNSLSYRRPTLWIIAASLLAVAVAAICLLANPISKAQTDPPPDLEGCRLLYHVEGGPTLYTPDIDVGDMASGF